MHTAVTEVAKWVLSELFCWQQLAAASENRVDESKVVGQTIKTMTRMAWKRYKGGRW